MATAVECGSLRCQRDSYAQRLSTVVLSCVPSSPEDGQYGTYAVELQDTVLFPEGGGQVLGSQAILSRTLLYSHPLSLCVA